MESTDAQPLLDDDARRTFTESLDENFCVSAGAGVGKTTAITRRIANLALRRHQEGNVLSRLVVVTYGKLAAEELRVRTRDLVLQHLDKSAHGRQTLLTDLRGAFFGTIHSFCLKLIREQGRFLGLPETVDLLEERDEAALWERFCEGGAVDALALPPHLLARVTRHLSFERLLELACALGPEVSEMSGVFHPDDEPPALDFSIALADDGGRSKEKTAAHQRNLEAWIDDFAGNAPYLELPEYTGGSKTFLAAVSAAVEPYTRWLNEAAGALAVRIARAFRDYRQEKGLMTYRDQIFWCRRLVEEPAVLARLRARGYRVILDEAQDTDADMFAILTEITRPEGATPGTWPVEKDAPGPAPGRFSFVGDDQQSIYSERANLAVYRRYIEAFKAECGGRHLEFSVTMRCPRRVIDVVNTVFTGGRLAQPFVEFRELAPRPHCPDGTTWRLDLDPLEPGEGRAGLDARVTHECRQVADFLATHGREGLGITHWSEVAVIAPRVRWLETAAELFAKRGLPGCLLSQKRIARELARHSWPAALFHVLVHPWDRFELIGVLREIFAVSDVDLARLHRHAPAGGGSGLTFWPQAPSAGHASGKHGPIPSTRLRQALELLHALRRSFPIDAPGHASRRLTTGDDCGTLSRYVDMVLRKTALAARLEAIGESSAALDCLRAKALSAECAGVTLRGWVRGLVDALEQPVPMEDSGRNAIQFLTCLKAKGLEWPVVIPLGLGCEIRERPQMFPRIETAGPRTQIHFSAVTVDPAVREERRARRAEELQRMLYVTFTRARRLLIVPDGSQLYGGQMPNFLGLALWDKLDLPKLFDEPPSPLPHGPRADAAVTTEDPGPPYFEENKRRLSRAATVSRQIPRRVLPSGLVHAKPGQEPEARTDRRMLDAHGQSTDAEDDRLLTTEEIGLHDAGTGEPLAGIGGIDYGNWWHAVLERYPWKARHEEMREEYLRAERARIATSVAWTSRAAEELQRFSTSGVRKEFLEAGAVFLPEMPFSHPRHADEWMEGIMDLVILTRNGAKLWIVDWKTDRRRPADTDDGAFLRRLAEKYSPQLKAYAEVFAQGLKRPVDRLLIYSTALGRNGAHREELTTLVGKLRQPAWTPGRSRSCRTPRRRAISRARVRCPSGAACNRRYRTPVGSDAARARPVGPLRARVRSSAPDRKPDRNRAGGSARHGPRIPV